jgi:hypothetical protein
MGVCVCVCRLSYPACKARASYYIVTCNLSGSTIFSPHYFIKRTIFGQHLLNMKCVLWFSLQLVTETFLILRIIQPDIIINMPIPVAARSKETFCPWQKPLPHHTQYSQGTDIHAAGGIRNCNPSQRTVADPRFWPRGQRDQTVCYAFRKTRKFE